MQETAERTTVRKLLATELAKVWHYRREGVYYLRIRPLRTQGTCTVSLRTRDRSLAMAHSRQIQSTLRSFHLNNPDSTWPELRERLLEIAEGILATPTEWERLDGMAMVYSDVWEDLIAIARTQSLSVPQAKAVSVGHNIMQAAQDRLKGDPMALVGIIEDMVNETAPPISAPLKDVPVVPESPPVLMSDITKAFLEEYEKDAKPGTLKNMKTSCAAFADFFGDLDMRTHSRADMNRLKDHFLSTLAISTTNVTLSKLGTVLDWAVNNGLIERNYAKKMKLKKGGESTREALTPEQVEILTTSMNRLGWDNWERWGMMLGAVTGARIGEISQLKVADVKEISGVWVIDINENDPGKKLKTKHSERLVPLVDGAYGFDLKAFLRYVDSRPMDGNLFEYGYMWFSRVLNRMLKEILGLPAAASETSYHSLRHSMASLCKHQGVPLTVAQSVLGHSSQSITFDLYGGGQGVNVLKLEEALKGAFGLLDRSE